MRRRARAAWPREAGATGIAPSVDARAVDAQVVDSQIVDSQGALDGRGSSMKFAANRLYIERYSKCPNCGVLLYETSINPATGSVTVDGKTYCSDWCVRWEADRTRRLAADTAGSGSAANRACSRGTAGRAGCR